MATFVENCVVATLGEDDPAIVAWLAVELADNKAVQAVEAHWDRCGRYTDDQQEAIGAFLGFTDAPGERFPGPSALAKRYAEVPNRVGLLLEGE